MTEEIIKEEFDKAFKKNFPEAVIIDGVNVAGCEHHLSTGYCQLQMIFQGMVLKLPFGKHLECNLCDKDCYYKQLKRLEQENKELKEKLDKEEYNACCECTNIQNQNDKYRSALEEIRVIADDTFKVCDDDCGNARKIKLMIDRINEVLQCE